MKQTKHSMAIVILAVAVGCTVQNDSSPTPPQTAEVLQVYTTADTSPLSVIITQREDDAENPIRLTYENNNHENLLNQLENHDTGYFLSHHLPNNTQDYWSAPIVQDAIAILVHRDNAVRDLTSEQLQRVYRGFITNWSELGGNDAEIIVYSREDNTGIRLEFERLVMGNQRTTPTAQILPSSTAIIEQIMINRNAIGYIPMSFLTTETQVLTIDTVPASVDTIIDNTYPLRLNIYAIGLLPPSKIYQNLFTWLQNLDSTALLGRYAQLPH